MLKRIPVDLSPLWINPENQFTVRFLDLSEPRKIKLADRIKKVAPQQKLKSTEGPTIDDIYFLLGEINPVIFQEGPAQYERDNPDTNTKKRWNQTNTNSIHGYPFTKLCQIIYQILCTKIKWKHNIVLMGDICYLSTASTRKETGEWIQATSILNQIMGENEDTLFSNDPQLNTETVGMEEIEQARIKVERNQQNNPIPQNREQRRKTLQPQSWFATHSYSDLPPRYQREEIVDYINRLIRTYEITHLEFPGENMQQMINRIDSLQNYE